MGASNYKTIMPAMEQQDRSVLVQLLHSKVISYTRRYGLSNHPSQGGCEDYCPFPSCIQADLLFPKKQEYSHGPPNDNQSYQKKYGLLPETSNHRYFSNLALLRLFVFIMRIDLGRFPPCFKASGVSAASAFAWLRTPRHRRSWGLPALQRWWRVFEMSQNWGISWSFVEGWVTVCLMLQVSCLEYFVLETFKRIWIDIPNLHDTPKSYPLKACNWGEKNLWALQ